MGHVDPGTGGLSGIRRSMDVSCLLKESNSSILFMEAGRQFHRRGPLTAKELCRCTTSQWRNNCFKASGEVEVEVQDHHHQSNTPGPGMKIILVGCSGELLFAVMSSFWSSSFSVVFLNFDHLFQLSCSPSTVVSNCCRSEVRY